MGINKLDFKLLYDSIRAGRKNRIPKSLSTRYKPQKLWFVESELI